MAEDPRTYQPSTPEVNRARMQGGGVGQQDMDMQQDPDRGTHATSPQRTEGWDNDPAGTGDDRGQGSSDMGAGAVSQGGANASGAAREDRSFGGGEGGEGGGERRDSMGLDPDTGRDEAGIGEVGDLGAGTPANVDVHKLGQEDNPEQDWGEPAGEGVMHSQTNTRRGEKTEAERGQGAKTRAFNKDQFSRRT